jgi:hypothetical protein
MSLWCRLKPAVQERNVHTDWVRDDPASHAGCVPRAAEEACKGTRSRLVLTACGQNWGKTRGTRGCHTAPCLALQRHYQQALGS